MLGILKKNEYSHSDRKVVLFLRVFHESRYVLLAVFPKPYSFLVDDDFS
jgi:hypothetical protein